MAQPLAVAACTHTAQSDLNPQVTQHSTVVMEASGGHTHTQWRVTEGRGAIKNEEDHI
jgi:hypothetical protein